MRVATRFCRPQQPLRRYSLSLGGNAPKGLHDLLPADLHRHEHIVRTGERLARTYSFEKVRFAFVVTPASNYGLPVCLQCI